MKKMFLDLEATGLSKKKNGVNEIACMVEIYKGEHVIRDQFQMTCAPHKGDLIEKEALELQGLSEEELRSFTNPLVAHREFKAFMGKYINPYDKRDKFHLYGYNISFDADMLRSFFTKSGDKYFGSWFWTPYIDIMSLAGEEVGDSRPDLPNFKLESVVQHFGIEVEEHKLHGAMYDTRKTWELYHILCEINKLNKQ